MANVRKAFAALENLETWDEEGIADFFSQFMEDNELKLGSIRSCHAEYADWNGIAIGCL
jgi:hypothetical protein